MERIAICIARPQMTLVLIEKGLVLEGWPSKIEVSWVLGTPLYSKWMIRQSPLPKCTWKPRGIAPDTPWKISMEPKSHPSKKENHFPMQHFWVPCWFSRVNWSISNEESKFLLTFLSFFLDSMGRVTGETVYTTSKYEWSAFFTFLAMNRIPRSLWFHFRFEILAQVTRGFPHHESTCRKRVLKVTLCQRKGMETVTY